VKTILIENMRIANLMNFLNINFENSVKFILKLKKILLLPAFLEVPILKKY